MSFKIDESNPAAKMDYETMDAYADSLYNEMYDANRRYNTMIDEVVARLKSCMNSQDLKDINDVRCDQDRNSIMYGIFHSIRRVQSEKEVRCFTVTEIGLVAQDFYLWTDYWKLSAEEKTAAEKKAYSFAVHRLKSLANKGFIEPILVSRVSGKGGQEKAYYVVEKGFIYHYIWELGQARNIDNIARKNSEFCEIIRILNCKGLLD